MVNSTTRFRQLSDFQYFTDPESFHQKIFDDICSMDLEKLKKLDLKSIEETSPLEIVPPPLFTTATYPVGYDYRQSKDVVRVKKGDKVVFMNRNVAPKTSTLVSHFANAT